MTSAAMAHRSRAIQASVVLLAVASLLTVPEASATQDPAGEYGLPPDASLDESALLSPDAPPVRPSARGFHAAAYDAESDRFVIMGGFRSPPDTFLGDVWAYDFNSNTWEAMPTSNGPSLWCCGASAYDSESDRIILFGGQSAFVELNTTWAYDYNTNTWEPMNPVPAPPPRHAVRGAYDAESDRIIVVGGHTGGGEVRRADAWAYDYNTNTWQDVTPAGFFRASYASMAYHAESDRVIHFSGENLTGLRQETWSYDYNTNAWVNLQPATQPSPQWIQYMAYDSSDDLIVLVGSGVTWTYDYNGNAWTEMNPATQPVPRSGHKVGYDAESDRMVFFGGCLGLLQLCTNDTWAYDLNTDTWSVPIPAPPFKLRNLGATEGEVRVDLEWDPPLYDGGSPITAHRIYRGPTAGADTLLGEIGSERTYTDTNVTGGTLYFYRLSAVTSGGEGRKSLVSATPLPDTTPPTVGITSPSPDTEVAIASLEVSGTASDNTAVEKVEISTDQAGWTLAEGTTSWSGVLTLSEGDNIIYARATDASGNPDMTSVPVTYTPTPGGDNGPGGVWWEDPLILGALLAAGAGGIAVVIVIVLRRRGKG